ncbi:hypothetical protein [Actinoplanes aureus]|nr:hypothetical protein [Actinoplanes aureus]
MPIAERWADADRGIVVVSGPTMGNMTFPLTPLLDDEEPTEGRG